MELYDSIEDKFLRAIVILIYTWGLSKTEVAYLFDLKEEDIERAHDLAIDRMRQTEKRPEVH